MALPVSYLPALENRDQCHTARLLALGVSANHVASGSSDGSIRVWDKHGGLLALPPLQGTSTAAFTSLAISEKLGLVLGGNSRGEVVVWSLTGGERKTIHPAHSDTVLGLAVDGRVLVSASRDGCSKIWEISTDDGGEPCLQLRHTLREHDKPMLAVHVLHNRIYTSSGDHRVQVWDRVSGECVKSIGMAASMSQVKVEVVGTETWLVGGCSDGAIRVYNMDEGAEIACLQGHQGVVSAVGVVAPDTAGAEAAAILQIASASYDGFIGFWAIQQTQSQSYSWQVTRWISFSDLVVRTFPSSRKRGTPAVSEEGKDFMPLPFNLQVDGAVLYCCGESAHIAIVRC